MATDTKKTVVLMVVVLLTCLSIPTEQATTPISSSATTAASAKTSSTESSTAVQQPSGPTDASTDQQSSVTTLSPSNSTPNRTSSNSTPNITSSNSTPNITSSNSTPNITDSNSTSNVTPSNNSTVQPNNVKTAKALTTPSPTPKRGHLLCYQCASSAVGELCETDAGGMLNASRDWVWHKKMSLTYFKDCTASNPVWDRCMIETISKNDKLILYHRGCHDGVTFGQKVENDSLSPRFHNLAPNNQSTCDEVGDQLYCYRFCNTDFCNGPEPPKPKDICYEYKIDPYIDLNGTVCAGSSLVASDLPITAKLLGHVMASVILIGWMTVT